jgi:hypothetical protein
VHAPRRDEIVEAYHASNVEYKQRDNDRLPPHRSHHVICLFFAREVPYHDAIRFDFDPNNKRKQEKLLLALVDLLGKVQEDILRKGPCKRVDEANKLGIACILVVVEDLTETYMNEA